MKSTRLLIVLTGCIFCWSCSPSPSKKVLVMASGDISIEGNTITLDPGTTHNEKEMMVDGDKLTVKEPAGSTELTVTDPGFYILNLKKDTLVGSYQHTGTDNSQQVISREDLRKRIDSLNQLMEGSNTSAEKRNFCIAPRQVTKISTNTAATVIGPYRNIPGSFEGGKEYELYKFYTNKEMREIVEKLKPMAAEETESK